MMAWNDERVAILRKMWLEGNSASEIAKELGNITRNAVIGKVQDWGYQIETQKHQKVELIQPKQ